MFGKSLFQKEYLERKEFSWLAGSSPGVIPGWKGQGPQAPKGCQEFIATEQRGKNISLVCGWGDNEMYWRKNGINLTYQGKKLTLAVMDDPRGIYQCTDSRGKTRSLQVFVRMCQNCIQLDFTTILGIAAASLVATVFLAIAVYYMAIEERGQLAHASDKQCLLASDQLYQPLQERNDEPYSHIGITKPRHR